jgi:hypothetical protein
MFDSPQSSTRASSGHQFDAAGMAVRDRVIRNFDRNLHEMMNAARSEEDWDKIADEVIAAHRVGDYKEPRGLRDKILKRFIEECTHGPAKRRYYEATKPAVVVVRHHDDKPKKTRQEIEARRVANRAERHKHQTKPGGASEWPSKNNDGKQKGGKNKK